MEVNVVCHNAHKRMNQIQSAINRLNGVQNYFYYKLIILDHDVCNSECVNWELFHNNPPIYNGSPLYGIYITEKCFCDNWFSHESCNFSIISTDSWEDLFAPPPLCVYLMYQIAQATINFKVDLTENAEMNIVHFDTVGCMFDFCLCKRDIKLGMVAGIICPDCEVKLRQYGMTEQALNAIEQILLYVRSLAIGKPKELNEKDAFIIMSFSKDDENDFAYKYGIKPALERLDITTVRADQVVRTDQIFNQVCSYIKKSRFIIAKVDVENLNVYFELGLAMGLKKDILLISKEEICLPTDLNNLECLTYPTGEYGVLCNAIVKFYKDNYGLCERSEPQNKL